jgi:hypothetical protein
LKITFEAPYLGDICTQMENFLASVSRQSSSVGTQEVKAAGKYQFPGLAAAAPPPAAAVPVENHVDMPVENPSDILGKIPWEKPAKPDKSEKQKAAAAKMRAAKAAKKAALAPPPMPMPPPPASAEGMDPAEVAKIRIKTIEELQAAYANGFQNEVLELLSRFGNGAKSFRELPVEAFVPIREAIDNGALT